MKLAVDQYLNFSHRKDLDLLFLRWPVLVSSSELRDGYLYALEEAVQLEVKHWLFDVRIRGQACADDIAWFFATFVPLTEKRLGTGNAFAYLVSPRYYAYVKENIGLEKLEEFSKSTKIKIFISEREALVWLTKCQKEKP